MVKFNLSNIARDPFAGPDVKKIRRIILYASGAVLFIVVIVLWNTASTREAMIQRDVQRIYDMREVQRALEALHDDYYSYIDATGTEEATGCNIEGQLVSECNLSKYLPTIRQIIDPSSFGYIVTQVPQESSYEITFTLERNYGDLASGAHTLSPLGIQ